MGFVRELDLKSRWQRRCFLWRGSATGDVGGSDGTRVARRGRLELDREGLAVVKGKIGLTTTGRAATS
jgi:hypothetical protein